MCLYWNDNFLIYIAGSRPPTASWTKCLPPSSLQPDKLRLVFMFLEVEKSQDKNNILWDMKIIWIHTLLCIKQVNNKDLLYSTGYFTIFYNNLYGKRIWKSIYLVFRRPPPLTATQVTSGRCALQIGTPPAANTHTHTHTHTPFG